MSRTTWGWGWGWGWWWWWWWGGGGGGWWWWWWRWCWWWWWWWWWSSSSSSSSSSHVISVLSSSIMLSRTYYLPKRKVLFQTLSIKYAGIHSKKTNSSPKHTEKTRSIYIDTTAQTYIKLIDMYMCTLPPRRDTAWQEELDQPGVSSVPMLWLIYPPKFNI